MGCREPPAHSGLGGGMPLWQPGGEEARRAGLGLGCWGPMPALPGTGLWVRNCPGQAGTGRGTGKGTQGPRDPGQLLSPAPTFLSLTSHSHLQSHPPGSFSFFSSFPSIHSFPCLSHVIRFYTFPFPPSYCLTIPFQAHILHFFYALFFSCFPVTLLFLCVSE